MKEANLILNEIKKTLNNINSKKTQCLLETITNSKSITILGTGRSGYIANSFQMRLKHLGIKKGKNLAIVLSGSGETKKTLTKLKSFKKNIICLTMNPKSSIAKKSNLIIEIKAKTSKQPLRSLFEQSCLIYLDGVVMMLMKKLRIREKEMWRRHE